MEAFIPFPRDHPLSLTAITHSQKNGDYHCIQILDYHCMAHSMWYGKIFHSTEVDTAHVISTSLLFFFKIPWDY